MALVFAQLGERRLRAGIAALLDRRLVAPHALRRFLQSGPRNLTAATACAAAAAKLEDIFDSARDGLDGFLNDGPCHHPQFAMLAEDIRDAVRRRARRARRRLDTREQARRPFGVDRSPARLFPHTGRQTARRALHGHPFNAADCDTDDAWRRHRATAATLAPLVADAIRGFRRDLNAVMSRGVWRIFAVALRQYQDTLESHALLDFSGVLERAIKLLKDLDELRRAGCVSNRATATSSWTNFRTRAGRSGNWSVTW